MNKLGVILAVVFFGFGIKAAFGADRTNKPVSAIEFGISKHAGLHYVNGGFNNYHIVKGEKVVAGYKHLHVDIDISSLWTWQADAVANDDVNRTLDLLSDDWFDVKKYPIAQAHFKFLPFNNSKVIFDLTIKGTKKAIVGKVKNGYLIFRVVLKDFDIDASFKRIFVGNYADVKVKLVRDI